MIVLVLVCLLASEIQCQQWGGPNQMYPSMGPMGQFGNDAAPQMMPMMYQSPYPPVPFQYMPPAQPQLMQIQMPMPLAVPATTPSTILSLIQSIATIMNQTSENNLKSTPPPSLKLPGLSIEVSTMTSYNGEWEESNAIMPDAKVSPRLRVTQPEPPVHYERQSSHLTSAQTGLARLINSLPAPDVMFRIGDLLDSPSLRALEKPHDMRTVKGFPIEKVGLRQRIFDDDTLLGLLSSGRWKSLDWKRKLLGVDELPTAEEGNALAQMFGKQ